MKTSLEGLVCGTEVRLGFLLVAIAESAYNMQDVVRGDEARARGQAAYFRASRLLAQVAEGDVEPLLGNLESLQSALTAAANDWQPARVGLLSPDP